MSRPVLGIQRLHSLELSVYDAAPWLAYFGQGFGFQYVGVTTGSAIEATGTRRHLLACGDLALIVQEAVHAGSAVRRYLEKHPEGISRVNFLVEDVVRAEEQLLERNATPIDLVREEPTGSGRWRHIAIATPIGDVEFGFVQIEGQTGMLAPGMEARAAFDPAANPLGITGIDHLTANTRTLMPVIAFYEHVLGFTRQWNVSFHTEDIRPGLGSGLKSIAMGDSSSGIRFATNEPMRPRFEESQIQLYVDMNRGPGVQHMAIAVADISRAVEHCRRNGIQFMLTPAAYYEKLPGRLASQGVANMTHSVDEIARLGILADGDRSGHLYQAFCQDQAVQFRRPHAGPLFIELIQRCGSQRFGEGNFRALFEASQPRD